MMNRPNSFTMFSSTPTGKKPTASKREAEEQRKKEDEQAAAQAFEEYVATFQQDSTPKASSKVWIKAGTYDAGRRQEDTKEKGKLYKPTSKFQEKDEKPVVVERIFAGLDDRPQRPGKKTQEKKKSNLEIFKEELKIIQEEREERHRLKKMLGLQEVIKLPPKPGDDLRASLSLELDDVKMGSIDDGDPNTTNIYLGNLPTKISEQQLKENFGKFGPLASVKVMWPRTEEEKARNRLSGFVAFMSRRDGERALRHLSGKEIMNTEVKLGWGKAVPIPAFPIYIPPAMLELTMPPPPSGLPFNAQPDNKRDRNRVPPPGTPFPTQQDTKAKEDFDRIVYNSSIKVVIPTDRTLLSLIHRMIEFVAREGPMFEAMIMNREINNPQYRFLFENQSPAHIYYRWKLFSIIQGDSTQRWRTEDFRMFKTGSTWKPPTINVFTQGLPDELIPEEEREIRKGTLSNAQRTRMERMLRNITPERHKIAEIMIFSIEHSEAIQEISECIKESMSNPKTTLQKKIARLYVISDVLYNCASKGMNAVGYRKGFKAHLPSIFQEIHYAYQTACSNNSGEGNASSGDCFKERVMACCRAWDDWGIYPSEFLIRLQNIFLGLLTANSREEEAKIFEGTEAEDEEKDEEMIRKRRKSPPRAQLPPMSALKLVRSLQSSDTKEGNEDDEEDIDGVPLIEEEDLVPPPNVPQKKELLKKVGGFVPSKWETIDPEEVKAGAVTTTSKWDLFEEQNKKEEEAKSSLLVAYNEEEDEDIDGRPMDENEDDDESNYSNSNYSQGYGGTRNTEEFESVEDLEKRRLFLREVELKVLAFQDELERRGVGNKETLVEEYRKKMLSTGAGYSAAEEGRENNKRKHKKSREEEEEEYDSINKDYDSGEDNRTFSSKRRHRSDRDKDRSDRERRRRSRSSSSSRSSSKKQQRHNNPQDDDRDTAARRSPSSRNRSRSPHHSSRRQDRNSTRSERRRRSPSGSRNNGSDENNGSRTSRRRSPSPSSSSSRRHKHKHKR